MFNDDLKMTGHLTIAINDAVVQEVPNLVVTDGKEFVASRMKDTTKAAMSHMAIGTGSSAAAAGNSALGSEANRQSLASTSVSGAVVTYVATLALVTEPALLPKPVYSTRLLLETCCAELFLQL